MEQIKRPTRRSSRIGLLALVVLFIIFVPTLAVLLRFGVIRRLYGVGPELTMESFIIVFGILAVSFFLNALPLLMLLSYRGAQQKVLAAKIKQDLWLCGLQGQQLEVRIAEFDDRNSYSAFFLPACVNLAFMVVMWGLVIMPGGLTGLARSLMKEPHLGDGFYAPDLQSLFTYMANNASLVVWVFLGAYFYILMVLIRRWLQSDLTTGVLWKINVRVAVALVVGLLLMRVSPNLPVFVAFIAGIVPDTVLRWLSAQVKRIANLEGEGPSKLFQPSDLQEKIDGLNFWQADRLSEEGIESIQDLAMREIPNLLIGTRFDTPHLLYWVDQALLCNQVGEQLVLFKRAFILTATDLLDLERQKGLDGILKSIQDAQVGLRADLSSTPKTGGSERLDTNITLSMLENIVGALKSGPNLPYVREYWKNTRTPQKRAARLTEMPR